MPPLNNITRSLVALAVGHAVTSPALQAATITVDNFADIDAVGSGCTLREAVFSANSFPGNTANGCASGVDGPDVIEIPADAQISLSQAFPIEVDSEITINGNNATIDGMDNAPVFKLDVVDANLTLNDATITGGSAAQFQASEFRQGAFGGGIVQGGGSILTINNSRFIGNQADEAGGAIFSTSTKTELIINDSVFSQNTADGSGSLGGGAAIFSYDSASLSVSRSSFERNIATIGYGGAIYASEYIDLNISDSTFNHNTAGYGGGGIYVYGSVVAEISNTTISNNEALGPSGDYDHGGGIAIGDESIIKLVNSTISRNTTANEGGGISVYSEATVTLVNTIVAGNSAQNGGNEIYLDKAESYGYINSVASSNNLVGVRARTTVQSLQGLTAADLGAMSINASSDGTLPVSLIEILGPLADNGGATKTHMLAPDSPAIDSGLSGAGVPIEDQRGEARSITDIGAVERVMADTQFDGQFSETCFVSTTGNGKVVTFCL